MAARSSCSKLIQMYVLDENSASKNLSFIIVKVGHKYLYVYVLRLMVRKPDYEYA